MSFTQRICDIYQHHEPRHILPFIGASYENASPNAFRVAVIGLNAYSEPSWEPKGEEALRYETLRAWWKSWWAAAPGPPSPRFFQTAYREADKLAREIVRHSCVFPGLDYDATPTKSGYYATNAVKIFLGAEGKTTQGMSSSDFQKYADDWHCELDVMAEHRVLPHLIVVFGDQIWEVMWRSFYPEGTDRVLHTQFEVTGYESCDCSVECYHFANRITARVGDTQHKILLARMLHPAAVQDHRAYWLLGQPEFRRLAGLL